MGDKQALSFGIIAALTIIVVAHFIGANVSRLGGTNVLVWFAGLALVINWTAFVPAALARTEKSYDLIGTLTYSVLVTSATWLAMTQGTLSPRGMILVGLVLIWSIRLGSFLFRRVHHVGKDARFDEIKTRPAVFFMSWTLQAAWAFLASMPVLVILCRSSPAADLGLWDGIGYGLWGLGFVIEVIADQQKAAFRQRFPKGDRWISEGLWASAQHPNYFGEILLWLGIFVSGVGVYQGAEWACVVSPLFVAFTLLCMSGVPMIRARNHQKWGDDPAYLAYLNQTNLLLPLGRRTMAEKTDR